MVYFAIPKGPYGICRIGKFLNGFNPHFSNSYGYFQLFRELTARFALTLLCYYSLSSSFALLKL